MSDPNSDALQVILGELRDISKDKRRTAVMKLGMLGGDEALRALIRTLENDYEDLIVRGRAAMMLGKVGDARAIHPLIRALEAPGYQTPLYAVESLGLLGDKRAIDPLIDIAANSRDRLQEAAKIALKRLGYTEEDNTELAAQPQPEL